MHAVRHRRVSLLSLFHEPRPPSHPCTDPDGQLPVQLPLRPQVQDPLSSQTDQFSQCSRAPGQRVPHGLPAHPLRRRNHQRSRRRRRNPRLVETYQLVNAVGIVLKSCFKQGIKSSCFNPN